MSTSRDSVELFNPTDSAIEISGWTLELYPGQSYTFRANTPIAAGATLLMDDDVRSDSPTHKNFRFNVNWNSSTPIEIILKDSSGGTVDYLALHSSGTGPNQPADHPWAGGLAQSSTAAWRVSRIDTNDASDWNTGGTGSLGSLNPGQ